MCQKSARLMPMLLFTVCMTPIKKSRSRYFILSDGISIYGGGGIAPLENYSEDVCELQKMYFHKSVRGHGFGQKMMVLCLD